MNETRPDKRTAIRNSIEWERGKITERTLVTKKHNGEVPSMFYEVNVRKQNISQPCEKTSKKIM